MSKASQPRRHIARVKDLAESDRSHTTDTSSVDQAILERIQKCLARANHRNAVEAEAQTALRMAGRLMEEYNITHADIIAAESLTSEPSTIAGQSTVSIRNDNGTSHANETWVGIVISAIKITFDCEAYSTARASSIDWTFYGIATNTVAAAMSFETVHNLVQDWSFKRKKGNKNSYRLGVAKGLQRLAKETKQEEEKRAREHESAALLVRNKIEAAQRQKLMDRLRFKPPKPTVTEEWEETAKVKEEPGEGWFDPTIQIKVEDADNRQPDTSNKENDPEQEDAYFFPTNDDDDDEGESCVFPATFDETDERPLDPSADLDDELRQYIPTAFPPLFTGSFELPNGSIPDSTNTEATPNDQDLQAPQLSTREPSTESSDPPPTPPVDLDNATEEGAPTNNNDDDAPSVPAWKSVDSLILFRQNAQKIAEDYLKQKDMKLSKGRKRDWKVKDREAYAAGKEDSRKIDLKRKRIEDIVDVVDLR